MKLVPLSYPLRSLFVRVGPTLFSAFGIGLTVAVLGGVLALREGFSATLAENGRSDVGVYLRPGATSEGESVVRYPGDSSILKTRPEVATDAAGVPLAAAESYVGVTLAKLDGTGTTIVTVRGIEPASLAIHGSRLRIVKGRALTFSGNELIVGAPLSRRMKGCQVGETLTLNVTPFTVVGIFEHEGGYQSEIWGNVESITSATKRPFRQRVIAQLRPGTDPDQVVASLKADKRLPVEMKTEREYFRSQTTANSGLLMLLATILTSLMGTAAVLGAVNTMLASLGARTREVGILMAIGYRGFPIFLSFLLEAACIGALGGALGCLLVIPLNGIETSTTNWNTFTEAAFAFRVTPALLARSVFLAVVLGLLGGAVPAWRASRLLPTDAMRRL